MRRRIYIDPEGDLGDHTTRAYLFHPERDPTDTAFSICDTGALYDDELWQRYEAACEESNRLRNEVVSALVHEPYDGVELAAREVMNIRDDNWDRDAMEQAEAQLLAHAATRNKP